MQWYYSKNATQLGPVTDAELRSKLASGEVSTSDMVWREGMVDWRPVSAVEELRPATVAGQMPPLPVVAMDAPYAPPAVRGDVPSYTPTSGLALASLICGILGLVTCMLLPGIPAVICGHLALKQMADPALRVGGRGLAIAGLILGYFSILVLVGTMLVILLAAAAS